MPSLGVLTLPSRQAPLEQGLAVLLAGVPLQDVVDFFVADHRRPSFNGIMGGIKPDQQLSFGQRSGPGQRFFQERDEVILAVLAAFPELQVGAPAFLA